MALEKSSFQFSIFFILLVMLSAGCSSSNEKSMPSDYLIFRCHSFYVIEHSADTPEGRYLLQLDREENDLITSVAYSRRDKVLAVALTNKEPMKGTAVIKLFNYPDISLRSTLYTGRDRINGMDFNDAGDLVFSAQDMNRNNTGELCYVKQGSKLPVILADKLFFGDPVWGTDSDGVYFPYRTGQKSNIAYLSIKAPTRIKEVGPGTSVSVSINGVVAYLNEGTILSKKVGQATGTPLDLPDKITDSRFTDSIVFVRGSDDLILQRYKKSTVYDLLVTHSPYTKANMLLSGVGMLDFDVVKK